MTHRDITGTDPQGGASGPRPDQLPHAPLTVEELAAVRREKEDEDTDPVVDVDELGAAIEGDGDRPVDATRGRQHVKKS